MNLTVNGQARQFADSLTGEQLLAELDIPVSLAVAELNGEVVPRAEFLPLSLADGDRIELITLVGGG